MARLRKLTRIETTQPKLKNTVAVTQPNLDQIIKSVRVYEKDEKIHLDFRVYPEYRQNGKDRVRFSTGEIYSVRAMQRIERDKFSLALQHYLEQNSIIDTSNILFGDIALDAINEGRGNRQDDVHNDYIMIYETYIKPTFARCVLADISVADVNRWKYALLKNLELSRSRYLKYHRTLNFVFNYGLINELISRNPAALVDKRSKQFVKTKKTEGEGFYTAKEAQQMVEHASGWFAVMLMTYLHTGMRTGEGLALKFSDINFEKQSIRIQRSMRKGRLKDGTKTDEDRTVRMSTPLLKALRTHKESSTSEWVFPNVKTDRPYCEANSIIRWHFKPLLEELGIEYKTFYALRHTFASMSAEQNIPMSVIQKQLGHKKLSTTMDFYIKHDLMGDENKIDIFDRLYA